MEMNLEWFKKEKKRKEKRDLILYYMEGDQSRPSLRNILLRGERESDNYIEGIPKSPMPKA